MADIASPVQNLDVTLMTPDVPRISPKERVISRETKSQAKGFGLTFSRSTKETVVEDCDEPEAKNGGC